MLCFAQISESFHPDLFIRQISPKNCRNSWKMGDNLERLGLGLESFMKEDLSMEIDPPFRENMATAEDWRKALNKVVPAVVVLRTTAARAFDTEAAGACYATGFVVDKRRGIILTNRHVVKPG